MEDNLRPETCCREFFTFSEKASNGFEVLEKLIVLYSAQSSA